MNTLTLELITKNNFDAVVDMSNTLTSEQKRCVAPNQYSIAEAYVNQANAWPRAICLGDKPIGFVMLDLKPEHTPKDENAYFLWRFMIDHAYQNKGYGKQALDLIVEKCKFETKDFLYTSCDIVDDMPYQFYLRYGFVDTGILDDDEEILKLSL